MTDTRPGLIPAPTMIESTDGAPTTVTATSRIISFSAESGEAAQSVIRAATGLDVVTAEGGARVGDIVIEIADGPAPGGYTLTADAGIVIAGGDAEGAHNGLQTLFQLLVQADAGEIPALRVEDAPRYGYRGVMLDVSRHFFDADVVLRLIERIAALKFNRLHLHLTDDQGWRIEIPELPELTRSGAATQVGGGAGGAFTIEDYRRIVAHAQRHHVVIVPEIDLPGHTNAALVAYPDLAPAGVVPEPYTGTEVGFSTLDLTAAETDRFVETVIARVAAETPGEYVHVGGDEAFATDAAQFVAFLARATRAVAAQGKTPIAWHEAGKGEDLEPGTVGQYWGRSVEPESQRNARTFGALGGVILSPSDLVYLDMKPTAEHPVGLTWSAPAISLEQAYSWDPADVLDGVPAEAILGVEAPLWTETVITEQDIEGMLFPRLLAVAEKAWSAESSSWPEFEARAAVIAPVLERLGIRQGPAGAGIQQHPVEPAE
ncbi:beta-N-acetylhexosaminidase [Microbacterium sp. NPDC057659]|uniref:beta-N-acetylhexosaminidase n=1 Tax=Microbacterium sp. NPDC057659 TaxID=3346198 RepID=UPI00366DDFD4